MSQSQICCLDLLFAFLLPFLRPGHPIQMTVGRVCWGMELHLLCSICRLSRCLWLSSLSSQDNNDGDEEDIRASAETSDQTKEDDSGRGKKNKT